MKAPRGNAWYRRTYTYMFADGRSCFIDYDVDVPRLAGLDALSNVRVTFSADLLRTTPDEDLVQILRGITQ